MMRWLGDRLFAWRRGWESAPDPLSCLPLLGLLAFLLAASVLPARGDEIPGFGAPWDAYYFSTDMTPVTVHIVRDARTVDVARQQPVVATARIPRAYVLYASPYRQPAYPILPDEIWVSQLDIMLVYPQGEPYSLVWTRLRAEGLSYSAARNGIRPLLGTVQLNANTLEYATNLTPYEAAARRVESSMDGVDEFRHSDGGPIFFRVRENPSIRIIMCPRNIERSHPIFFCQYHIRLSADVRATARFVDFRLHGGPEFASERVAHIREVLCGFVTCDPRWAPKQPTMGGTR